MLTLSANQQFYLFAVQMGHPCHLIYGAIEHFFKTTVTVARVPLKGISNNI